LCRSLVPSKKRRHLFFARFIELEREIIDREEFLVGMEAMGQGPKYRGHIHTEISGIIREMEKIDLERNTALQSRLDKLNNDHKQLV